MEIKNGVYYVGVLNPNLRVFDIIMRTDNGTSYNAYLIKSEKNVLIDTVHEKHFEEYIANIKEIVPIEEIDYLITNHTEPDHSGSIEKLLKLNNKIKVIGTMAASRNLSKICNMDISVEIAKDKDELKIGDKTLQYIIAPFLHWPDTMFTYLKEDNILFTCDFLGTHYCEPHLFDTLVTYPDKYEDAFKEYYDAIFNPFKSYVLAGIEKIKNIDFDIIAPSHGPILTDKNIIKNNIEKYINWSEVKKSNLIVIAYVSAYGYTKLLAQTAEKYIKENTSYDVECIDIIELDECCMKEKIEHSKAFMLGSPTINRDALKPVLNLLSNVDVFSNKGKFIGLFGSYGWSGEALQIIKSRCEFLGLKPFEDGYKTIFKPSELNILEMQEYTKRFLESLL